MKSILVSLLALLVALGLSGQQVSFFHGSWEEANEKAATENKFILVDAYTKWCGFCKLLDEKVLGDSIVASYINEHFVPVRIDFNDSLGTLMARKFRVTGYPTLLVFNPGGQLVDRYAGYGEDHSRYIEFFEEARKIKEERVFAYDSRELDMDWPDIYLGKFGIDRKDLTAAKIDSMATEYLDGQDDLYSEVNWSVLFRYKPKAYEAFLIENMDRYSELYGTKETQDLLGYIIYDRIVDTVALVDTIMLNKVLALTGNLDYPESSMKYFKELYYERRDDWKGYCNLLEEHIEKNGFDDHMHINNSTWALYENTDDKVILEKAAGWMEVVTKEHPVWMYLDTYAALLYKLGEIEMAEKVALRAIEKGKEEGTDRLGETEKLLEKIRAAADIK